MVLGIIISVAGRTPAGLPFAIPGAFTFILAMVRWRDRPREARPEGSVRRGETTAPTLVSDRYLLLCGLGLAAGTAYLFYRGAQDWGSGNIAAFFTFVAGAIGVVLTVILFGALVASRRFAKGKAGPIARRWYAPLAQRAETSQPSKGA
jgi:pilus assembly protein TadC